MVQQENRAAQTQTTVKARSEKTPLKHTKEQCIPSCFEFPAKIESKSNTTIEFMRPHVDPSWNDYFAPRNFHGHFLSNRKPKSPKHMRQESGDLTHISLDQVRKPGFGYRDRDRVSHHVTARIWPKNAILCVLIEVAQVRRQRAFTLPQVTDLHENALLQRSPLKHKRIAFYHRPCSQKRDALRPCHVRSRESAHMPSQKRKSGADAESVCPACWPAYAGRNITASDLLAGRNVTAIANVYAMSPAAWRAA